MIGIFDSGYGGLTVFKEIEKTLPQYDYIYLGDNARAPYGDLSQELIYNYSRQAVDFLFAQGCELIIFACNTASATALRRLQQEYLPVKYPGKNVLGVIRPMVEAVLELGPKKVVAVMGTKSTVDSGAYINEFANLDKSIKVVQEACPLLVPLIEASKEKEPQTKEILKVYTNDLKQCNPEVVVLGCTHYGWLWEEIKNNFSPETIVLESGQVVAKKLFQYLQRHPHYAQISDNPSRIFLTSGNNKKFDLAAKKFLGREIKSQTVKLN
ncbi:MAG: glutamate racemase [Patescibacteria group bacterium]|nr:glutamate racemase [Patescibacteria group bacterium]